MGARHTQTQPGTPDATLLRAVPGHFATRVAVVAAPTVSGQLRPENPLSRTTTPDIMGGPPLRPPIASAATPDRRKESTRLASKTEPRGPADREQAEGCRPKRPAIDVAGASMRHNIRRCRDSAHDECYK